MQLRKKPEKFQDLTEFEPVISRYRCDALTIYGYVFICSRERDECDVNEINHIRTAEMKSNEE